MSSLCQSVSNILSLFLLVNKKSYTFIKFSDISEFLINIQLMFCLLQKKIKAWQGPILPGSHPPSTFGAEGLNFRVRNVTGCTTFAILTKLFLTCIFSILKDIQNCIVISRFLRLSLRHISIGQLNALLHVHPQPINLLV